MCRSAIAIQGELQLLAPDLARAFEQSLIAILVKSPPRQFVSRRQPFDTKGPFAGLIWQAIARAGARLYRAASRASSARSKRRSTIEQADSGSKAERLTLMNDNAASQKFPRLETASWLQDRLAWGALFERLLAEPDGLTEQRLPEEARLDRAEFDQRAQSIRVVSSRKQMGAYYTPPELIEVVLEGVFEPLFTRIIDRAKTLAQSSGSNVIASGPAELMGEIQQSLQLDLRPGRRAPGSTIGPASDLLAATWEQLAIQKREAIARCALLRQLRICDPAVGSGAFLLVACARLANCLADWRAEARGIEATIQDSISARQDVIREMLFGIDLDAGAIQMTRWLLQDCQRFSRFSTRLERQLVHGNSLLGATWDRLKEGIPDRAFSSTEITADEATRAATLSLRQRNRRERREGQWQEDLAKLQQQRHELSHKSTSRDRSSEWNKQSCLRDETGTILTTAKHHDRIDRASQTRALAGQLFDAWSVSFFQTNSTNPKQGKSRDARSITQGVLTKALKRKRFDKVSRQRINTLAEQFKPVHWPLWLEELGISQGFDAIIGNPPFVNAIEGSIDEAFKRLSRVTQPRLRGTADLGYRFLDASLDWVAAAGRVGFVLPRGTLNSVALQATREFAMTWFPPSMIYAPGKSDFFAGAQVFVCALVLGGDGSCRVSLGHDATGLSWKVDRVCDSNWWSETQRIGRGASYRMGEPQGQRVADRFEVAASLIARDAYDLRSFVMDDETGVGLKLMTTGLIEPGNSLWGVVNCRYLRSSYRWPRVCLDPQWPQSLAKRYHRAQRPKVLIAGLSSRVEALLDAQGEMMGSVSTFSIFHPEDDVKELSRLEQRLNSLEVSRCFRDQLGGNAMGGGNITMNKRFLAELPWDA